MYAIRSYYVSETDTITWTISTDDFDVDGHNYVTGYKVYGDGVLLTNPSLDPGSTSYDNPTGASNYEISTVDYCGNESEKLSINAVCVQSPAIEVTSHDRNNFV